MDRRHKTFTQQRATVDNGGDNRSHSESTSSGEQTSGTYAEMVEEVQQVSEMLRETQSKLWESQDALKTSTSKTQILESALEKKDQAIDDLEKDNNFLREEEGILRDEVDRLNQEILDRDEGRSRPELEKRLRKAIEFLKKDVEAAREKAAKAEDENLKLKATITDLEKSNKQLNKFSQEKERKFKSSDQELLNCQKELLEAKEANAFLVEEVASLRDDLQRFRKIAEQRDILIRQEVEGSVKERIKHDVRELVTRQVTAKVTREVTSKMKAERDAELDVLREKIRQIVKENSLLKSKIDGANTKASEATNLEDEVNALKYELTRYESLLDDTYRDQQLHISKMETQFRINIQNIKEQSAKEKWAHASEIRKQMTFEREQEVAEFTKRVEEMSKHTDRLLQRAEKEKDVFVNHVKKRLGEEKQREIQSLVEMYEGRQQDTEQMLRMAAEEKILYGDQVRKEMENHKEREISKYTYRIGVLEKENEALNKRVGSFEHELSCTWQENKNHFAQLKLSHGDIKSLEDEIFKLKRKNQNLSTLVTRYKEDSEEAYRELKKSKQLFREALLKSEERAFELKTELESVEPIIAQSKTLESEVLQNLENDRLSLLEQLEVYKQEMAKLREENVHLNHSMADPSNHLVNERGLKTWCTAIQAENTQLQQRIELLNSLLTDVKGRNYSKVDDALREMETENSMFKESVREIDRLLQTIKSEAEIFNQGDCFYIERLKERLQDTGDLIDKYHLHRNDATIGLENAKQIVEDLLTVVSEDDTAPLSLEIRAIDRLLKTYDIDQEEASRASRDSILENRELGLPSKDDMDKLKAEIIGMISSLNNSIVYDKQRERSPKEEGLQIESQLQEIRGELDLVSSQNAKLEATNQDLKDLLEKYRGEISQMSIELDHARRTLALEGETATQLHKRVESLNLLLETTEQYHAENSRDLKISHQRLDEATLASKKECERLRVEISSLQDALSKSESELVRIRDSAEVQGNEDAAHLDAISEEAHLWKNEVENLEKQKLNLLEEKQKISKELAQSKKLFNEAISRSEKEIVHLKHQVEVLAEANANYVARSAKFESSHKSLQQALVESEIEKKERMAQMETLLRTARNENLRISRNIRQNDNRLNKSLRRKEEKKEALSQSMDKLRQSFLSNLTSSVVKSPAFEKATHHTYCDASHAMTPFVSSVPQCSETRLTSASQGSINSDDTVYPSISVSSISNDLFGEKKSRVSWKMGQLEQDASSTITGNGSLEIKTVPSAVRSILKATPSFQSSTIAKTVEEQMKLPIQHYNGPNIFSTGDDASHSEDDVDDFTDALTFQEAVKRSKEDLHMDTNQQFRSASLAHSFSVPEETSISNLSIKTRMTVQPTKKMNSTEEESVSWKHASAEPELESENLKQNVSSAWTDESRDPTSEEEKSFIRNSKEIRNGDTLDDGRSKMRSQPDHLKTVVNEKESDDDSTINWNIQQNGGSPGTIGDFPSLQGKRKTEEDIIPGPEHPRIEPLVENGLMVDEAILGQSIRGTSDTGKNMQTRSQNDSCASSASLSFSYSSNESILPSSAEAVEDRQPQECTSAAGKTARPTIETQTTSPGPVAVIAEGQATAALHRRKKSGFQRALEKASRRNWSKQELSNFITTKNKPTRTPRVLPPASPTNAEQPFDERRKGKTSSSSRE